jgi:hypothetical protein
MRDTHTRMDRFGGIPKFTKRPVLFLTPDNRVVVQFVRRAFTGFRNVPRSPDIPPITEAQAEALDALHFIGMENSIQIQFEPGDFQFLNNLNLLHSRNSFRDGKDHKSVFLKSFCQLATLTFMMTRRHVLRMWLRDDEYGWQLPTKLTETLQWKRLWELDMKDQYFPLEPQVKVEKFK